MVSFLRIKTIPVIIKITCSAVDQNDFFRIRIRLFYIVLYSDPVSDPAWILSRNSKFYQLVSSDSFRIRSYPDPAREFWIRSDPDPQHSQFGNPSFNNTFLDSLNGICTRTPLLPQVIKFYRETRHIVLFLALSLFIISWNLPPPPLPL